MTTETKPLTFGQKAVGLTFNNPGGAPREDVHKAKQTLADAIDQMKEFRDANERTERARLASIAITELQGAQMWMVKALTWQD